jgi:hypothetical protein
MSCESEEVRRLVDYRTEFYIPPKKNVEELKGRMVERFYNKFPEWGKR